MITKYEQKIVVKHLGAAYISWNPDSKHLIACGPEESPEVWLWNLDTEKFLKVSQSQEDALTCCAWHKDGKKFVVRDFWSVKCGGDLNGDVV